MFRPHQCLDIYFLNDRVMVVGDIDESSGSGSGLRESVRLRRSGHEHFVVGPILPSVPMSQEEEVQAGPMGSFQVNGEIIILSQ